MSHASTLLSDSELNGYIDGQLEPYRAAEIAAALDADPKVRARVDAWKKQNEALRTMFASIVFDPVPVRLMPTNLAKAQSLPDVTLGSRPQAARPTAPRPEPPRPLTPRPQSSAPPAGSSGRALTVAGPALAAFLLGIAMSFGAASFNLGPRFLSSLHLNEASPIFAGREIAKRAAEAHQTYATDLNRPVEIPASDEVHLVKWIQHRLTMPIRIPDLHLQGWNLIGGRVIPGELGPAAFLVYGNGVERLGLYIARTNAPQADDFATYGGGAGNASVGYWIDEPFGYAITTSRGTNWLDRNGPALYDSVKAQTRDNASAF